jgi:3-dehydroquinate synthase
MVVSTLPYAVTIEPGALDSIGAAVRSLTPQNRVVIITDKTVEKFYASRVSKCVGDGIRIISISPGEQAKTRETWSELTDALLAEGYGRDTTIIALGGGVIGDLVGFVAATYLRGVPYIQVPTTLLAMVDSSIGGKTGVDTSAGKNLVGAFHPPVAVLIDPRVLATLPVEQARAGFAEIVKHGVIADHEYFDTVAAYVGTGGQGARQDLDELTPLIRRSVEIKSAIVAKDERESGLRKVLNFGHTIGHAIEAASEFKMLHGEAVAIGLVAEARLAERLGIALQGTARNIEGVCRAAGLPTAVPSIPVDVLLGFTRADKKARQGKVEYALPKCIGEMAKGPQGWTIPVEDDRVREALVS